jgi:NAD(P)-dependent dehydrogenase (short-subunit alcohol dehydrogenase family)
MGTQALDAARLFDLTGRTAIVTGASSGLGVTFAQTLAANGANLVLAARRRDRLEAVAAELAGPGGMLVVECDITRPDQIEAMCDSAIDRFGALDILVANAGVVAEGVPAPERTPPDAFAMGVDVNITGTFNTVTAAARRMLAAGGGSIIITASVAGISGHRGLPPAYCASKAAQIQIAKHLAATWADRGVRVNAIAPAWFPSEMTNDFLGIPAWRERCEEQTPLGRIGAPHELAGPLLLLASDAGSYITGSVLTVDGGWTSTTGSSPYSAEVIGIFGEIMPEGLGVPIVPA